MPREGRNEEKCMVLSGPHTGVFGGVSGSDGPLPEPGMQNSEKSTSSLLVTMGGGGSFEKVTSGDATPRAGSTWTRRAVSGTVASGRTPRAGGDVGGDDTSLVSGDARALRDALPTGLGGRAARYSRTKQTPCSLVTCARHLRPSIAMRSQQLSSARETPAAAAKSLFLMYRSQCALIPIWRHVTYRRCMRCSVGVTLAPAQ
mmetsp:Transcript_49552/g.152958  ORF Transcript_49552/g.152958 Transcript_49552/m.152958 type:complete len:202 (-) Transcript_49552:505-1110(-)